MAASCCICHRACPRLISTLLTMWAILLLAVGVPVGRPPFEPAPYGGHRSKKSTKEVAEDDSDEEDSESSEEEVVSQVSAAVLQDLS